MNENPYRSAIREVRLTRNQVWDRLRDVGLKLQEDQSFGLFAYLTMLEEMAWNEGSLARNEEVASLTAQLAGANKKNQRMWDLLRYQRQELHTDGLITDDEYTELAKDHPAVKRLEDYDEVRAQLAAEREKVAKLESASKNLVALLCDEMRIRWEDYMPADNMERLRICNRAGVKFEFAQAIAQLRSEVKNDRT